MEYEDLKICRIYYCHNMRKSESNLSNSKNQVLNFREAYIRCRDYWRAIGSIRFAGRIGYRMKKLDEQLGAPFWRGIFCSNTV
jgi:hypothetical protein